MGRKLVVEWVCSCDLEDSAAKEVGVVDYGIHINFIFLHEPTIDAWYVLTLFRLLKPIRKHGNY
jgi:hypothetical protein